MVVSLETRLSQAVFFSASCNSVSHIIILYFLRYFRVANGLGALY
jgi:hypothetical protein